jgi:hypothetical protein
MDTQLRNSGSTIIIFSFEAHVRIPKFRQNLREILNTRNLANFQHVAAECVQM